MTKFVAIVYDERDGYVAPRSITVIGIYADERTADAAAVAHAKEYRYSDYDVQEVEQ